MTTVDEGSKEAEMSLLLRCPFCAEPLPVEPDTFFCEACGEPLAEPATGEEEPAEAAEDRACVSCGGTGIDQEGYCTECGDLQPRARDRMEGDLGSVAGISDRGRRHHQNEDAMAFRPAVRPDGTPVAVAVVCDGVSSSERPESASAAASAAAGRILLTAMAAGADPAEATVQAARAADEATADQAKDSDHGNPPACTLVSAIVAGDVTVGWLGDSRAYWLDERGGSQQLTVDDAEPGTHAIAAWLGADSGAPDPHIATFTPEGPGVVLVCSDGLWNYVPEAADLAALALPEARTAPFAAAGRLVDEALAMGGHDNITVVLVPYPVRAETA